MRKISNIAALVRPSVLQLKPYASARDEYVSDGSAMVFLDANENPFNTAVNRYPDPYQRSLKEVLGALKNAPPRNLLLGNGSDEVLDLLFRAFCEPGQDHIISLPPSYGMYTVLAGINNVGHIKVPLSADFQPNVAAILAAQKAGSKLLFLCSPNNPTGNNFDRSLVTQLLENFEGIVVIDEAYIDFSEQESWLSALKEYPNLVVTQTLSKAYGMAGIRLGLCWASEEILQVLNKIKPPYNVNELTQQRALTRLANKRLIELEIEAILSERHRLESALKEISFIEKCYPSAANFILAKVDDSNKRYQDLLQQGIVVRNRGSQHLCANTLRFTVGTAKENNQLIQALKAIV